MRVIKLLSWHAEIAAKASSLKAKGIVVDAAPLVRTSGVVGEMAPSLCLILIASHRIHERLH